MVRYSGCLGKGSNFVENYRRTQSRTGLTFWRVAAFGGAGAHHGSLSQPGRQLDDSGDRQGGEIFRARRIVARIRARRRQHAHCRGAAWRQRTDHSCRRARGDSRGPARRGYGDHRRVQPRRAASLDCPAGNQRCQRSQRQAGRHHDFRLDVGLHSCALLSQSYWTRSQQRCVDHADRRPA